MRKCTKPDNTNLPFYTGLADLFTYLCGRTAESSAIKRGGGASELPEHKLHHYPSHTLTRPFELPLSRAVSFNSHEASPTMFKVNETKKEQRA